MRIVEYAKAHPIATGIIAVIGGIIFIVIVRGGSGGSSNASSNRPSDAEIAANAAIESARINAQAVTAQAGAAVSAAQVGAGVQLNSDNKAAEVAMEQIRAARDIGLATVAAESNAFNERLNIANQERAAIFASLPSLKKKNRDDVLQAYVTGQPYYPQASPSRTAQVIGSAGGLVESIGKLFSDSRLKENIQFLGQDKRGRNVYGFNYKGSKIRRRGYMAEEIERLEPEKVMIDPASGYRMLA